jgi:16S rRNA (guanine527-N7)-methyltransferase
MTMTDSSEAGWIASLASGARELGLELTPRQLAQLWQLANLLRERNQVLNLTSVDSLDGILTVHIFDSLSVAAHLGGARRVIDVGTGGGFPGLPLAVVCPERQFVLIDGTQKKIAFVRDAIAALGLENVTAEAARAEQFKPDEPFDAVLVRAVGALDGLVKNTRHLLRRPGGRILAMKGKAPVDEIAALPRGWRADLLPLTVPLLAAERHLVVLAPPR